MGGIGGMVLAAGLSERMVGSIPKQLLPLHGTTMAAVTVRNAEASRLDRVVAVVGHRAGEVAASLSGGRTEIVDNPDYRKGNMSSFRVGAAALDGCEAVVVLLADMPDVTTAMIDRVVDEWHRNRPWAAVCSYTDRRAHPLLLSATALGDAARAEGAKGVWRFLAAAAPAQVRHIDFDIPAPGDVNTREDYRTLLGG